jgi:sirohydrochlorin ferrochelatase
MNADKRVAILVAGVLAAAGASMPMFAAEETDHSAMDHSTVGHSTHSTARDELGRSLLGMKHEMSPTLVKELRDKVALWRNASDAEIALSMEMMGPEYAWYISPPGLKGEQGLLILTHGFREQGDKLFRERVQPMGNIFPTALGIGMAMMMSDHIQVALDDLVAAGAREIVVVPVVSSASNELYRQWLYIFGRQESAEFATVPRVKTSAAVRIIPPPGDNPLIAEILLDHAMEISADPKSEVVIIAGHGPSSAEDNERELKVLAGLARIIQEDGDFASVQGITLQDDSAPEVRAANVKRLRAMIETAQQGGKRVLVVTNLIGARTIQGKLREDLEGLEYKFNSKGIAQHDNFIKWMGEAVRKELENRASI